MINVNENTIMEYAKSHGKFSKDEMSSDLSKKVNSTETALSWHLNVLTKKHKIVRTGHGIYSIADKNIFAPIPSKDIIILYDRLKKQFPFANFCIYEGSIIAPFQHHLSTNNIIYIETNREAIETVFNLMKNGRKPTYFKPTQDLIYHYVDMNEQAYFIKPMVSESPLQTRQGVPCPTIEKLLVDIRKDADFFYLQGQEYNYILENAFNFYHINESRLLRYASRRGIKEEMKQQINKLITK